MKLALIYSLFSVLIILAVSFRSLGESHTLNTSENSISSTSTSTSTSAETCRYMEENIDVVGNGPTKDLARADASEKCFDQKMSHYKKRTGKEAKESVALDFIDSCVNIACS